MWFVKLFHWHRVKCCLLIPILFLLSACDGTDGYIGPELPEEKVERGRLLFLANCSSCHGTDAKGVGGRPDIRGRRADQITTALATVGMMRHIDVNASEIDAIATYLGTLVSGVKVTWQQAAVVLRSTTDTTQSAYLGLQVGEHKVVANAVTDHLIRERVSPEPPLNWFNACLLDDTCHTAFSYPLLAEDFERLNSWLRQDLTPRSYGVGFDVFVQRGIHHAAVNTWLKALSAASQPSCQNPFNVHGLPIKNDLDGDCFADVVGISQ